MVQESRFSFELGSQHLPSHLLGGTWDLEDENVEEEELLNEDLGDFEDACEDEDETLNDQFPTNSPIDKKTAPNDVSEKQNRKVSPKCSSDKHRKRAA